MAELREAFSKVGECSQQEKPCGSMNLWQALSHVLTDQACWDGVCSSSDLLHHSNHRKTFSCRCRPPRWNHISSLQSIGLLQRIMLGLQQGLRKKLKSVQHILKCFPENIVNSWQIIWKSKRFYFRVNWVFPMGRKGVERTNVQMDKKFVVPSQWPFKPHISTVCFLSKPLNISSDLSPLKSHRPITVYPNSKKSPFTSHSSLLSADVSASLRYALISCPCWFRWWLFDFWAHSSLGWQS